MKKSRPDKVDELFRNKFSDFESDPLPGTKEEIFLKFFASETPKQKVEKGFFKKCISLIEENKYSAAAVFTGILISVSVLFIIFRSSHSQPVKEVMVLNQSAINKNSIPDLKHPDKSRVVEDEKEDVKNETFENQIIQEDDEAKSDKIKSRNNSSLTRYNTEEAQALLYLPDSSKVYLNKHSNLSYSENPDNGDRIVELSGEAFFEVKKKSSSYFIVNVNNSTIKVLGTAFNIKALREEKEEVVVSNGTVLFYSKVNSDKAVLTAGDKAYCNLKNRIVKVKIENPNELSWKNNKLEFNKTPMNKVIHDIKRHFDISITVANEKVYRCHFTGVFEQPTLEEVLQVLALSVNGTYEIKNKKCIIRGKGCS